MSDELARRFHDIYERLAPEFGYETRPETRVFDPESPNGKLMIAVCAALSTQPAVPVDFHPGELERMNERGRKAWAGVDLVDGHIAEPSPVVPGGLIECLRGGRQCDESGEEIIMSRQACCEAADILERIAAPPAPAVKLPLSDKQAYHLLVGWANDDEDPENLIRRTEAAHGIVEPAPRNDAATGQIKSHPVPADGITPGAQK